MTCQKCGGLIVPGDFDEEQKCIACGKRTYRVEEEPMGAQNGERCQGRQGRGQCTRTDTGIDGYCPSHSGQNKNASPKPKPVKAENPNGNRAPGHDQAPPQGVGWGEWKDSILAQMDQAIESLEEQLAKTKQARAAVADL